MKSKRYKPTSTKLNQVYAQTLNKIANKTTSPLKKMTRKIPIVGHSLRYVINVPMKLTKALPRAAGRIADTGVEVIGHTLFDPIVAIGVTNSYTRKKSKKSPKRNKY